MDGAELFRQSPEPIGSTAPRQRRYKTASFDNVPGEAFSETIGPMIARHLSSASSCRASTTTFTSPRANPSTDRSINATSRSRCPASTASVNARRSPASQSDCEVIRRGRRNREINKQAEFDGACAAPNATEDTLLRAVNTGISTVPQSTAPVSRHAIPVQRSHIRFKRCRDHGEWRRLVADVPFPLRVRGGSCCATVGIQSSARNCYSPRTHNGLLSDVRLRTRRVLSWRSRPASFSLVPPSGTAGHIAGPDMAGTVERFRSGPD
ncbi:hypothetical protein WIMU106979_19140 [Williamsia muralis]